MDSSYIKYPIYIISKGRWQNPLTAKFLIKDNIPFTVAVEPQEYQNYCDSIGRKHVVKLPFSNLGLGSYPARNWCWEDSLQQGFSKHFIFDDNIRDFVSLSKGKRVYKINSVLPLVALQNFTERYNNIAISGYNYESLVTRETKKPFSVNTHVYSGMLINNSLRYRWRMKYNEDVDLCLQVLNDQWCTILFNAFLINKTSTVAKMKGGNQDELYKNNNRNKKMLKSKSLEMVWPQYVKVVERFGRPHHQVSWKKFFKHPLKRVRNYTEIVEEQSERWRLCQHQ